MRVKAYVLFASGVPRCGRAGAERGDLPVSAACASDAPARATPPRWGAGRRGRRGRPARSDRRARGWAIAHRAIPDRRGRRDRLCLCRSSRRGA